jgi:hypothetical protein
VQVVDVGHVDGVLKHAKVVAVKLNLLVHGAPGGVICEMGSKAGWGQKQTACRRSPTPVEAKHSSSGKAGRV